MFLLPKFIRKTRQIAKQPHMGKKMAAMLKCRLGFRVISLTVRRKNCSSICCRACLKFFSSSEVSAVRKEPKIYTRTGDKGTTSLFTGERRPKSDPVFEALGAIDELNSSLGIAREFCIDVNNSRILNHLEEIQCILQDVGSHVATPLSSASPQHTKRTEFTASTEDLEKWIDAFSEDLPPLRNFILPSGGKCSASLHVARSICRRLERSLIQGLESGDIDGDVYRYVNRLSDFLFTAARFAAHFEGKKSLVYQRKLKTVRTD